MRIASVLSLCMLVMAACVGPHSSGALWSQQYVEQERVYFATPDAQRRAATTAFELGAADSALSAETSRIDAAIGACPGQPQPLQVSPGDKVRDGIRIQAGSDGDRMRQVAQLALADWYVRRASAAGDARFCLEAQSARAGTLAAPDSAKLLDRLSAATVSRGLRTAEASTGPLDAEPLVTLSQYALGSIDTVRAAAPLPQYLAAVYGGVLQTDAQPVDAETAAATVDAQAAAYPDWEPDALYAALRGAQP